VVVKINIGVRRFLTYLLESVSTEVSLYNTAETFPIYHNPTPKELSFLIKDTVATRTYELRGLYHKKHGLLIWDGFHASHGQVKNMKTFAKYAVERGGFSHFYFSVKSGKCEGEIEFVRDFMGTDLYKSVFERYFPDAEVY
jgi:hypothetical protein